jgi:site-specific DNA-adenine methylase
MTIRRCCFDCALGGDAGGGAGDEEGGMKRPGVPRQMPDIGRGANSDSASCLYGVQAKRQQDTYTMTTPLKAPYPWPGGKSDIAPQVWRRFGVVDNYVEPFAGSSAMLLGRPGGASGTETVNDLDGLLVNALRAITYAPEETAAWCDWPVSEADLTSRHLWLKAQRDDLTARLFGDPLYCDPQAAGWWLWGIASWIGDGWCVADGPWISVDGRLVDRRITGDDGEGVRRKMPMVGAGERGKSGMNGVMRSEYRAGVPRKMPEVGKSPNGQIDFNRKGIQAHRHAGVRKKMPEVGYKEFGTLRGVQNSKYQQDSSALLTYFAALSDRLRRVRFLCGDWQRAVKDSITVNHGLTALYLDPPYPSAEHGMGYHGDNDIWHEVAAWAVSRGDDKRLRIAISGYYSDDVDAIFPASWARERWQARGGYSNQSKSGRGRENAARECIWYSPHCIDPANDWSGTLFEDDK